MAAAPRSADPKANAKANANAKAKVARVARVLGWTLALLLVAVTAGIRGDRPAAEVEARRATPPSKFVTVDGLRTHYRDRGAGPVVVLVHGSSASLFTWEAWATALAADYRVVTLDLPGHGLTGPDPKRRYTPAEMAGFLDQFLTAIGVARATIVGNSMGGNVAWHYALAHPERVERLILVDAAGYPREEPLPFGFRLFSTPVLGSVARWVTPRVLVARSLRDAYGDPARVNDATVDLYEDLLRREGNREATRQRFIATRVPDGLHTRLTTIRVPTLILWGARDRWILPKYGERFARDIPGARYVVLDGLGHTPMEEDPAVSLAPVLEFLRQGASGKAETR
jgi:pimeloyl-ACP methyl ester carboxylesterase